MNPKNYLNQLPSPQLLKSICKARAVLDSIICGHEFETYHNYFKSQQEEYDGYEAQMGRGFEDEDGISLSFYFFEKNCLIVPSSAIPSESIPNNREFERKIPKIFLPYYKKNFSNTDVPFVIWSLKDGPWQYEENFGTDETIAKFEQLSPDPKLYKEWALNFFDEESFINPDMKERAIADIYEGKVLTERIVFDIVTEVSDWIDLEEELNKIPYRFDF